MREWLIHFNVQGEGLEVTDEMISELELLVKEHLEKQVQKKLEVEIGLYEEI